MTDQMPTRHQTFLRIRDGLTALPEGADHNGVTAPERDVRAAHGAAFLEASQYAYPVETPAPQVGMKPNPAQGHSGAAVAPTGSGGSLRDRMRANAQAALDAGLGAH